ncbi:MAG TPA: 50S ribosomal protein L3 N(5)-glutamine methyltransferase [Betaproteobacteria bacterium]|nr:50S ribosomal protein L3 N(5)-glutamine methyltransferase [Betaproteobacteria bacterium]
MFQEAESQLRTLRDVLRFSISRFNEAGLFFGHGTTNAHDEAAYLILYALHLPPGVLDPYLDARLTRSEAAAALALIARRIRDRVPAAYLTHEAWLSEYKFFIDQRAIVPRSFIAALLMEQLSPWVHDPSKIQRGLDLCTGSGCLAILMALAFSYAAIDAADISKEALEVAHINVSDYGLGDQIRLLASDLFTALGNARYDLIVSNPPYVDTESMEALPVEYLHEPRIALTGGEDGLDYVRTILRDAPEHLNSGGLLIVEIGHNRLALEMAYPNLDFTWLNTHGGGEQVFLLTREQLV